MKQILVDLDFSQLVAEAQAQTQTGKELLDSYRAYCMSNPATCALVNNFIKEAAQHTYDGGINSVLESVTDYVNCNKTRWQIATACENIDNSKSSYNYLNLNAAKQAAKLIDLTEDECVKYIKSGALKNIMYCEAFRTIAKQVYKDNVVLESDECKITHPVSIVEKQGTDLYFEVAGNLYKINENDEIMTADWSEVSNTFKTVASVLESKNISLTENVFSIVVDKTEYQLSLVEEGEESKLSIVKLTKDQERELTLEQLREDNRITLTTINPRFKTQVAAMLESIAVMAENLNRVIKLDNTMLVEAAKDKFVVIEHKANIYATLLASTHNPAWTINESACKAIDFIKSKTHVDLSEQLKEAVKADIANVSEEEKAQMEKELKDKEMNEMKARIEALTEKFKNEPAKLAVLAKLAADMQTL